MDAEEFDVYTGTPEMSDEDRETLSRAGNKSKAIETILRRELAEMGVDTKSGTLTLGRNHLDYIFSYFEVPELDNPNCDLKAEEIRNPALGRLIEYITDNSAYQETIVDDEASIQDYALV